MLLSEIQELLKANKPNILLLGDSCHDYYHYGEIKRISPEAPIPIFDLKYSEKKYGMASNVYGNLKKFDLTVHLHTNFRENIHRYIDCKSNQQVIRIDEKNDPMGFVDIMEDFVDYDSYDIILISDYDKGTLSYENIETIINIAKSKNIDIFINTKKNDLARFEGAFVIINQIEYDSLISKCSNIIEMSPEIGIIYHPKLPDASYWFPATDSIKFKSITGINDAFLAALSMTYNLTKDIIKSIRFANKAIQVSIQHHGCIAPTLEVICD